MENGVSVDNDNLIGLFRELNSEIFSKVFKNTMSESLKVIKDRVISNLQSVTSAIDKKDKWNNTLRKGVISRVYKDNVSGVVHIMGNFKLKFFQNGTQDRYIKKWKGRPLEKP